MSSKALLIEDEDDLVEPLRSAVADLGMELDRAADGPTGLEMALGGDYQLIILDIRLPGLEGVEVCKTVRERNKTVPIIMLTSLKDELNKVLLLELGADDYLTKPYSLIELKARIKAVLRRTQNAAKDDGADRPKPIVFGDLEIDPFLRTVTIGGKPIDLTAREFDLLACMASQPGRPFTRDELNTAMYGYEVAGYDYSISSHINRIRNKIEENPRQPKIILTVHGVGYRFTDPTS